MESNGKEQAVTPGVYYPKRRVLRNFRQKQGRHNCERLVTKTGEFSVEKPSPDHKFKLLSNWFLAMVEARWRWTLLNFFFAFSGDWMIFGLIYWTISLTHGDLNPENLPPYQNSGNWTPCIENIYGFTSTFLFSVEVHTTVAYGSRSITLECPQAIFAMCMQCILSSVFQAFMVGILFAKLTRPKARTQTILFSKNAVVCLRDDKLCLIFRVGDMRKSRILDIKPSIFVVKMNRDGEESEYVDEIDQKELSVELDGCESTFFLWPVSVIHVIDKKSPLFSISAADLLCGKLELLVVFEGTIESTGQPVQARSSYTESEILWGHRFVPMVNYDFEKDVYDVDFSKLSYTEQIDTPLCSSNEYEAVVESIKYI